MQRVLRVPLIHFTKVALLVSSLRDVCILKRFVLFVSARDAPDNIPIVEGRTKTVTKRRVTTPCFKEDTQSPRTLLRPEQLRQALDVGRALRTRVLQLLQLDRVIHTQVANRHVSLP